MAASQDFPPDFVRQNKGPTILAVCCTLSAIGTVFVAGRLYVRAKLLNRVALDDWLIIASMVCSYILLGFTIKAVDSGNGRHFILLSLQQKSDAILYTMAGFCPGVLSFGLPKVAVVALLTKIMNPSRKHKIFLWFMSIGCVVLLLGCIAILFGQCTPSRSQWDFSVKGKCWNPWILVYYSIGAGSFSAAVDLYLAIYPGIVLWKLQMNLKKKLALSMALGLGSVAAAVAIYKSTRLPALASKDFSYDTSDITVWTSIEGNSIIIAACIPTLQPLLDRLVGGRFFSTGGDDSRKYRGYGARTPNHELNTIGGGRSRGNKSNSKHPSKMGISDVTLGTWKGSQESILGSEEQASSYGHSTLDHDAGIRRTQHVTVAYEEGPPVTEPRVGMRKVL